MGSLKNGSRGGVLCLGLDLGQSGFSMFQYRVPSGAPGRCKGCKGMIPDHIWERVSKTPMHAVSSRLLEVGVLADYAGSMLL